MKKQYIQNKVKRRIPHIESNDILFLEWTFQDGNAHTVIYILYFGVTGKYASLI